MPLSATDSKTAKLWNDMLLEDRLVDQFFGSQLMSASGDNLVFTDSQLGQKKGNSVTVGVRARVKKGWLASGVSVAGNEYESVILDQTVSITDKQLGIKSTDRLSEQRGFWNMSKADRQTLIQMSSEAHDLDFFKALDESNTEVMFLDTGVYKATHTLATATAAVKVDDFITPEIFSYMFAQATTGFNDMRPALQPVRVDGRDLFIFLTHPDALAGFENDTTFLQAQREAQVRGESNPLFRRARAIWRDVLIMTSRNVTTGVNGSGIAYVRSHFLGKNALTYVQAELPEVQEKNVPYTKEERAYGYFELSGVAKTRFTGIDGVLHDFGAITAVTARPKVSDIAFV